MHFPNIFTTYTVGYDTELIGRTPLFRAGIYKELSGLYLYGSGSEQGVSPNNDNTNDDPSNRQITGWNSDNILADSRPNWVGFLNYKSNNEVHFNNYQGNDNNGSRHTILSRSVTRTNKHFLSFSGAIMNALTEYCGQVLLDNGTQVGRKAKAVIIIGSHPELEGLGYPSSGDHIWLITKSDITSELVVEDIIHDLRVRFQMVSTSEVLSCFHGDDMFFIADVPYPSNINYPYIFSEDVLSDLNGVDNTDIKKYLTVYSADQNNYLRGTGLTPLYDVVNLQSLLPYLNKDNFKKLIINKINHNNIIKSYDSDDLKFKKLVEFYSMGTSAVIGDSSSCHFIREENNIDIFLGGTQAGFPEIYPVVSKTNVTSETALELNLTRKFFEFIQDYFLNVLGITEFYAPNIIDFDDALHLYYTNIINIRKQQYHQSGSCYEPMRNSDKFSLMAQSLTFDVDDLLQTNMSTVYLPSTVNIKKIFDRSKAEFCDFQQNILHSRWTSYPFTYAGNNTDIARSLEYVGKDITVKSNSNNILYSISRNAYFVSNTEVSESQQANAGLLSDNSLLRKVLEHPIYSNEIEQINIEFIVKKPDNTEVPFLDYSIIYQALMSDTMSKSDMESDYSTDLITPFITQTSTSYYMVLLDQFYNSDVHSFIDFISYKKESNNITLKFDRESYNYALDLNLHQLDQGDILLIKITDPYDATKYFNSYIIKETKELTSTVSSYSFKSNTREYYKTKISNFTFNIDVVYPDPSCGSVFLGADFNQDGLVDASDLTILLGAWGEENSPYSLSGELFISAADIAILLGSWGSVGDVGESSNTNCSDLLTLTYTVTVPYMDAIPESIALNTNIEAIMPDILSFFPNQIAPISDTEIITE